MSPHTYVAPRRDAAVRGVVRAARAVLPAVLNLTRVGFAATESPTHHHEADVSMAANLWPDGGRPQA